ncbi:MAG: amidohydrolase [Alphaproteobacteria bacterium]|nr:MAG: amidohydrolase [Alphaproteobacteria bacterium]
MKRSVRRGLGFAAGLLVVVAAALYVWLAPPAHERETLFTGGTILTMAEGGVAEALLVRDGRIVAVGSRAAVETQASHGTHRVDLEGRTLMPGLIEPHTHPLATALLGSAIDVSGFRYGSRAEVMNALRQGLDQWQPGAWSLAFGWDPVLVPDLDPPTLAELDALSPDRPLVILSQMMHDAYANSAALRVAGIDDSSPNPPAGELGRDADGHLNGTLRELGAIGLLFAAMPPPPEGSIDLLLNLQLGGYARAGYTTIGVAGPVGRAKDPVGILKARLSAPDAPLQGVIYALPTQTVASATPESPLVPGGVVGVKFWMDGSPYTGGAAFAAPYADTALTRDRLHLHAGHMGALAISEQDFAAAFEDFHRRGFQIAVHAQGERAVDRVLDTAERVLAATPRADHRHRLEHNALITEAQLRRAKALGFTTSFFIDHIYYYGDRLPDLIGPDPMGRYMPLKTAIEAGHHVSIHGDHPATPIGPFRSFATAVLRKTRDSGTLVGDGQQLTRLEALRAMTTEPAWQLGLDKDRGSLEPGKAADLVLLSDNPLTVPDTDLRDIAVLGTWIAGQRVDSRKATAANAGLLWHMLISFL